MMLQLLHIDGSHLGTWEGWEQAALTRGRMGGKQVRER